MKYHTLSLLASTAFAYDACTRKPDGTKYPDPDNAQGYIECQDGQITHQVCPDAGFYDSFEQTCGPQKMCHPPSSWKNFEYTYVDGIYYHTWIQTAQYGPIQGHLLCDAIDGTMAQPYTEEEYTNMKTEQNRAIQAYLASDECVNARRPGKCNPFNGGEDYEFYMGIESFVRDCHENEDWPTDGPFNFIWDMVCPYFTLNHELLSHDQAYQAELEGFLYSNYYYVMPSRHGRGRDWCHYGDLFTQNQWWMPGYPTNETPDAGENFDNVYQRRTVQVGDKGLKNIDHTMAYADGVNCMYVCNAYGP